MGIPDRREGGGGDRDADHAGSLPFRASRTITSLMLSEPALHVQAVRCALIEHEEISLGFVL
jgi:hypothetical protein